jgi:predicted phosphodiesterase
MADFKKIFFLPDTHVPFHDKRAWKITLKAIQKFNPDVFVILGDFADFYSVSFHDKDPRRKDNLYTEVEEVKKALGELAAVVKAKRKIFVAGNHEFRLERYLTTKAPELFPLVSIPGLLDLDAFGYEYVAYRDYVKLGKLLVTHDTGTAGQNAHLKSLADAGSSVVIGHTHRMSLISKQTTQGEYLSAAMFGWLGDKKAIDYMHKTKTRNWTLGFGIGYQFKDGTVQTLPVPIIGNKCILEGKLIK